MPLSRSGLTSPVIIRKSVQAVYNCKSSFATYRYTNKPSTSIKVVTTGPVAITALASASTYFIVSTSDKQWIISHRSTAIFFS